MIDYLRQYTKAIVALLAPLLVTVGARAGLSLSDEQALTLATLITGFLVYLVPNKTPTQPGDIQAYVTALEKKVREAEEAQLTLHRKGAGE